MDVYESAKAFMEKAAGYGSVLGLSSVTALMEKLKNPQNELSVIHVAGTNGKGSTCAFLQSILTRQGYRVGVYTSPAVFCYEERFAIDGAYIKKDVLCDYILRLKEVCDELEAKKQICPTIFEIETAIAFLYFKEMNCDFAIVEVGMGGETDATNVICDSVCSVFTAIGRDHMRFLGNTIEEIAAVKSGILKEGGTAVSIWQEKPVEQVLLCHAQKKQVKLCFAKKSELTTVSHLPIRFHYKEYKDITLGMLGAYQIDNCVLALEVISELRKKGYDISDEAVRQGTAEAQWAGRMEKIADEPPVYIDGAHNLPAAKRLAETIQNNFTNRTITFIIGVLADKEHKEMMELLLPYAADIVAVTPSNPRRLPAKALVREIEQLGYRAYESRDMTDAWHYAKEKGNDVILAFGSLSYLQEFKACVLRETKEQ